ncbi:MAG TPA: hypothetical protein PK739_07585, partial [Methanoculleus sp.]|nr:hypothetical protein [Methanoculleus sp.]
PSAPLSSSGPHAATAAASIFQLLPSIIHLFCKDLLANLHGTAVVAEDYGIGRRYIPKDIDNLPYGF